MSVRVGIGKSPAIMASASNNLNRVGGNPDNIAT
jgi:hypothetical protein